MEDLNALNGETEFSLDDLTDIGVSAPKMDTQRSNKLVSAKIALLSSEPEQAIEDHLSMVSKMDSGIASPEGVAAMDEVMLQDQKKVEDAMSDFLLDPTLSDQTKTYSIDAAITKRMDSLNIDNVFASNKLEESLGELDTFSEELVQVDMAQVLDGIVNYRKRNQVRMNLEMLSNDKGTGEGAYDIFQAVMPYYEQAFMNNVNPDEGPDAFLALGSNKAAMRDVISSLPIAERDKVRDIAIDMINNNSEVALGGRNDFLRAQMLSSIFDDNYYTDTDKVIDNIVSVLDLLGVGSMLNSMSRASKGARAADFLKGRTPTPFPDFPQGTGMSFTTDLVPYSNQTANAIMRRVSPIAPLSLMTEANPKQARALLRAIEKDETGELAEAIGGGSLADVVADNYAPQTPRADGGVQPKLLSPDVDRVVSRDGAIYYSEEAKEGGRLVLQKAWNSAITPIAQANMSTFGKTPNGMRIQGVYSPREGAFIDAEQGLRQVAHALRDFGVTEDNLEILRLAKTGDYIPATREEAIGLKLLTQEAARTGQLTAELAQFVPNFKIRVNLDYQFNPTDIYDPKGFEIGNLFGVSLNFFDSQRQLMSNSRGTATRHLFDPMSLFTPSVTRGAVVGVDRSAAIERELIQVLVKEFAEPFQELPAIKQEQLLGVLKKQNHDERFFSPAELGAEGLTPEDVKIIQGFRVINDHLWRLENTDLKRTFSSQGIKVVEGENLTLYAKPVNQQNVPNNTVMYDADSDKVIRMTNNTRQSIVDSASEIGTLVRAMRVGPDVVTHVVTMNKSEGSYMRAFNRSDNVLNYTQGHFSVKYDANYFLTKAVFDNNGNFLFEKAVATARNTSDAERKLEAIRRADPDEADFFYLDAEKQRELSNYQARGDKYKDGNASMKENFEADIALSSRRSAQKFRGERLQDASGIREELATDENVLGPVDSLVTSVRSVSQRTAMRPYIEAIKSRYMQRFSGILPKGKTGEAMFPSNLDEIGRVGQSDEKLTTDARTVWEYINFLENNYINDADELVKSGINMVAKIMAGKGGKIGDWVEEGGLSLSTNINASSAANGIAFKLLIAANPLRQLLVQGHQAVQLQAVFPKYYYSKMLPDVLEMTAMRLGATPADVAKASARSAEEIQARFLAYMDSGFPSSIDKQSMVDKSLASITEYSDVVKGQGAGKKILRGGSEIFRLMRVVGFDIGEELTMMSSWVAHYDKEATAVGKALLDNTQLEKVAADARNFTGNMNRAGDFPYNHNALKSPMQFAQVTHKFILQMTTNQTLTKPEKAKLAAFNLLTYGVHAKIAGIVLGTALGATLPDWAKDTIRHGSEATAINGMMGTDIDFKSFSPIDSGFTNTIGELWRGGFDELYSKSPSASLFVGDNARISNFFRQTIDMMHAPDSYDTPTQFLALLEQGLSLMSGVSNAFKSAHMLSAEEAFNRIGSTTDRDYTKLEAIFQAAGFPTRDSTNKSSLGWEGYKASEVFKKDINTLYKNVRVRMKNRGIVDNSANFLTEGMQMMWLSFPTGSTAHTEARRIFSDNLRRDMKDSTDISVVRGIKKNFAYFEYSENLERINRANDLDEEQKQYLIQALEQFEEMSKEIK